MNAIQFIKEHTIEKARGVVDGAPDKTATHYVFRKIPSYYSVEFQSWYHDGEWWDSDCHTEQDLIDSYGSDFVLSLSDLKNLIANIDSQIAIKFIKEWGDDYSKKYIALSESEGNILPWELSLKRLVESVDIISKFDSVQEAKDAIANAPEGATEFRKLSCSTRYIKVGPRFFEYWDGFNWCRPTVPFTDETHILRFTELSKLKQAIADYEAIGGEHV